MKKLLYSLAAFGLFAFAAPAFAADGSISGTVTHAVDGTAINAIGLTAANTSTGSSSTVYADSNGVYSFTSMAPGTYDVSPFTYVAAEQGIFFIKKTSTITIGDGEAKTDQNFALVRRARVTGHVYQSDGITPIANANLSIVNSTSSADGYAYGVMSLSSGQYSSVIYTTDSTVSSSGTYTFTVTKSGYDTLTLTNIALSDDAVTTQDMTLTVASSVSGTIKDANGNGLANATVTLTKSAIPYTYSATTDTSGAYTVAVPNTSGVAGSTIGDYTLTVSKTGYVTTSTPIALDTEPATLTGNNFTLATAKTFSGTVKISSSGAALAGATVSLFKRNAARSTLPNYSTTSATDGTFSLTSVAPGKYRVTISRSRYVSLVIDSITITANVTGVVYQMELGGSIKGLVYTSSSSGVDGATIAVYALNNGKEVSYTSTTANDTGNYLVTGLKKGTYRLVVTTTDYVQIVSNVAVKTDVQTTKNFKLSVGGSVSGYITDKVTGLPVSGGLVKVVGTTTITSADANGFYTLDGIAKGNRRIVYINAYYDTSGQKLVKVSAGKTKTGVNFSLNPKQ